MTKEQLFDLLEEYDNDEDLDLEEILRDHYERRQALMEEIEERQHKSGSYAQQDLIDMYRRER